MQNQTKSPHAFLALPRKQILLDEFVGKPFEYLRTPAMIIDRAVFAKNCALMHERTKDWGAGFRAHVKTHKVGASKRTHNPDVHE